MRARRPDLRSRSSLVAGVTACGGGGQRDERQRSRSSRTARACHAITPGKPSPDVDAANLADVHPTREQVRRADHRRRARACRKGLLGGDDVDAIADYVVAEDGAVSDGLPPDLDPAAVRAVAMDMDRTILPYSLEFSPALVRGGRRRSAPPASTAIIATGRMFASARPYALQLGVTAPVICYQGALVADPAHRRVAAAPADGRRDRARGDRGGRRRRVPHERLRRRPAVRRGAERGGAHLRRPRPARGARRRRPDRRGSTQPTTKIVVVGEPERARPARRTTCAHRFDDRLFIAKSLPIFLEVARPGVSKGAALEFVCDRLGIDPGRRWSRSATARTTSSCSRPPAWAWRSPTPTPRCVAIADWTVPSVDEDGVAGFLRRVSRLTSLMLDAKLIRCRSGRLRSGARPARRGGRAGRRRVPRRSTPAARAADERSRRRGPSETPPPRRSPRRSSAARTPPPRSPARPS